MRLTPIGSFRILNTFVSFPFSVPSTPVPGLTARATSPSSIDVTWATPNEIDIPGIFTGYALYYKEVSSASNFWYPKKILNTNTHYALSNLKSYTNYTVNVTVLSLEGDGIPATVYVMTEEDGEIGVFQFFFISLWITK